MVSALRAIHFDIARRSPAARLIMVVPDTVHIVPHGAFPFFGPDHAEEEEE
jgi:hypothetical protein